MIHLKRLIGMWVCSGYLGFLVLLPFSITCNNALYTQPALRLRSASGPLSFKRWPAGGSRYRPGGGDAKRQAIGPTDFKSWRPVSGPPSWQCLAAIMPTRGQHYNNGPLAGQQRPVGGILQRPTGGILQRPTCGYTTGTPFVAMKYQYEWQLISYVPFLTR